MKKLGVIVASVTLLAFPIVALASEVHVQSTDMPLLLHWQH